MKKLRGVFSKENTRIVKKCFLSSSLHGFPSHFHTCSETMVSYTLFVEGFFLTIKQFFRPKDPLGGIKVDAKNFNIFLDIIMMIISSKIFEGIHDKCRVLFNNLIPYIEERCIYNKQFLLKHMESLVKEIK